MGQDIALDNLLDAAERSLVVLLAADPTNRNRKLLAFYAELRSDVRRDVYPSARDLFWDHPQTPLEEICLQDALKVFEHVRAAA
jgi:hypothetical protein